jgi:ankyrin repeat protein
VAHGADIKIRGKNNWQALDWAVSGGDKDTVEFFLNNKCEVNSKGWSALHQAVQKGTTDVVALLLAHGADVNARAQDEWAPLHEAVKSGHKDLVELLLEHGADINAIYMCDSSKGGTPLHVAAQQGRKDLVELLFTRGATMVTARYSAGYPLHTAVEHAQYEIAELLLARGAEVNAVAEDGGTPLHRLNVCEIYGKSKCKEVGKLLITHGAEINARDNEGMSPLHRAASYHSRLAVEFLLSSGANASAENNRGETPLEVAERGKGGEAVALLRSWTRVTPDCSKKRHVWGRDGFKCSKCGESRDLIGMTVVAAGHSLQPPLDTAPERDRSFFCVSKASLGNETYDGLYDGFWLVDGTKGTTAFFVIEKVLNQTPAWVIAKYPRVASVARVISTSGDDG